MILPVNKDKRARTGPLFQDCGENRTASRFPDSPGEHEKE